MLSHATRKNIDIAVLITGDEDYVPLVVAVKAEGTRVLLCFFDEGLSPVLKRTVDKFTNIGELLYKAEPPPEWQ